MDVTALGTGFGDAREARCPEEQLEAVEQEVHRQLQRTLREPVTAEEFDRALQLVRSMAIASASKHRAPWQPALARANVVGSPPRSACSP